MLMQNIKIFVSKYKWLIDCMSSGLTHPNKVLWRKTGIILYEKKDGYNLLVLLKL